MNKVQKSITEVEGLVFWLPKKLGQALCSIIDEMEIALNRPSSPMDYIVKMIYLSIAASIIILLISAPITIVGGLTLIMHFFPGLLLKIGVGIVSFLAAIFVLWILKTFPKEIILEESK